jgi:hypothetical protein
MRHLLVFKPITVHMSFDVAKLFAVRMSERRGNLLSLLARWPSTSLQIASHPGPLHGSGWAVAVAALRLEAHFLDVEVDAPPLLPPPPLPPWVGGGLSERYAVGRKSGCSYGTW